MTTPARPAARGFALVVGAALCWGTSGVTGDAIARRTDLDPLDVAWYRMAISALVLGGATLLTRRRRPARPVRARAVRGRLLLVAAGLATYQAAYFAAVAAAGVSIATLVALGLAPLLVAVGAAALGHGRPDRATGLALAAALVGLVLLVGVSAGDGETVLLGALAAVGCAVAYAGVVLASSGVPDGVPTTTVGFVGGALLLTPVALAAGLDLTGDPVALLLLLYLGAVPSALAYGMFFAGVRAVPAAVASIVTLLEPLTATVLATVLLGERLAPTALAGGALMLGAVTALYLRRMGDSNSRGVAPNPLSKRAP